MSLEINVDKDVFLKAIVKASCALGSKNDDDKCKNFGIEVTKDEMVIIASKQEVSSKAIIRKEDGLEILGQGKVVLDGYNLLSNVNSYHQGVSLNIRVEESDGDEYEYSDENDDDDSQSTHNIVISYDKKSGGGSWEHKHFLIDDKYYPATNFDWTSTHSAVYDASRLVENIAKVSFAASEEDYRQEYNVVMLEFGAEGAVFFATDGRQLAYVKDPADTYKKTKHAMIEAKIINQISKKNILDQSKTIDVSIADAKDGVSPRIRFLQDDLCIISNFNDQASKPPYEKILNFQGCVCQFTLDVKRVKEDLKALSPLESKETLWSFGKDKILVQNTSFQGKQTHGEIDGVEDFEGEDCEMKFSLRYWDNLLNKSGAEDKIKVQIKAKNIPIVISVSEDPCVYTFCIQPIKDIKL
jgi:DNA polymerase III sliding clamp (beta) subunit (PCNA family)